MNGWVRVSFAVLAGVGCSVAMPRSPADDGQVTILVENRGAYLLRVRACGPYACSAYAPVRPGSRTRFAFPAPGGTRFMVTGMDGDRVAVQVPVEVRGPGLERVVLQPAPRQTDRRVGS